MTLLLFLACVAADTPAGPVATPAAAPALPESDAPFAGAGRWTLDGHDVTLAGGTLYGDGVPVLAHVYDHPVAGPDALWVPADPGPGDGGVYRVFVADGLVLAEPRLTRGRPERFALAPDGAELAFVSGASGLASLWSLPTAGGEPRQLTNVGLRPTPGAAPAGFVPPPDRGPPRFLGDHLVWTAQGVEREVAWR